MIKEPKIGMRVALLSDKCCCVNNMNDGKTGTIVDICEDGDLLVSQGQEEWYHDNACLEEIK